MRRSVVLPNLAGAATGLNGITFFAHEQSEQGFIYLSMAIIWFYLADMQRTRLRDKDTTR